MRKKSLRSSAAGLISRIAFVLLVPFLLAAQPPSEKTPFSQDSAWAYLNVLAGEIGPRPMGSPGERAAMEFAVGKFRSFGLQEAFILPMRQTVSEELKGGVNTNSGTAVGVLKGKTNRIILIGGHIDSAGPDIPGANDDGSGSATVLELARVLALRSNESTIVFALFGGEEQGLRGSRYFVKNFDRMEDIALMLQIDMTNGSDWLLPLVDTPKHSSPEWLVKASYEEFSSLGYTGLSFPTHFYAFLSSMPGGGIGSDHEPFLERGIPAIDFTSDVSDPIHSPQDNLENFIPSGLKRSGDLAYRLVERFDGGVPPETSGSYYVYQVGSMPLFFPLWSLYAFIFTAIGLGVFASVRMRGVRVAEEPKAKIPALKLFLIMMVIQTCVWLSENIVGLIKGNRFPWLSNFDGYFVLGFLAGVLGIWISLHLVPRLALSRDPYRYALKSLLFLGILTVLMMLASPKLALASAMGLFFLSIAFLVDSWYLKFIFWLVSPHFMYRLIFSEGFGLIARSTAMIPGDGILASILIHAFYILFFSFWAFPFLLGFAAIRLQKPESFMVLAWLKKRNGGVLALLLFASCVVYLALQPTYTSKWRQHITVQQTVDHDRGRAFVDVASPDYLGGATLHFSGKDSAVTGFARKIRVMETIPTEQWIRVERTVETIKGTNTTFTMLLQFHFKYRPYTFEVAYRGGTSPLESVDSPFAWSPEGKSIRLRWYSFPDTLLVVPLKLTVVGADTLSETVSATFVEQPVPVEVRKEDAKVVYRTSVSGSALIRTR